MSLCSEKGDGGYQVVGLIKPIQSGFVFVPPDYAPAPIWPSLHPHLQLSPQRLAG